MGGVLWPCQVQTRQLETPTEANAEMEVDDDKKRQLEPPTETDAAEMEMNDEKERQLEPQT